MSFNETLKSGPMFRYMLLDRLRSDCEYYLGNGLRNAKNLWAGDEVKHIFYMKSLWQSFPETAKPEWLSLEKIQEYGKAMCPKAILVERDYKGEYERFALTPEEFAEEFPETYKDFGPIVERNTDTLKPLVHIWFMPCVVGDSAWEEHFTDMEQGLPDSDIEAGNFAYIREDFMRSLKKYLPVKEQSLDEQIVEADSRKPAEEPSVGALISEIERE